MLYSKREAADNHDGWGRKNKGLLLFFFLSFLTVDAPGLKPRTFVDYRRAMLQQHRWNSDLLLILLKSQMQKCAVIGWKRRKSSGNSFVLLQDFVHRTEVDTGESFSEAGQFMWCQSGHRSIFVSHFVDYLVLLSTFCWLYEVATSKKQMS